MKNCVIGQSGGPSSAINASLAGAALAAMESGKIGTVYGMVNGMQGFMEERLVDFSKILKTERDKQILCTTPASFLGSCRFKLPSLDLKPEFYEKAFKFFEKYNIGYFFYIGGNDSMDAVNKLDKYAKSVNSDIRFIGLPKTIDNDLPVTDHTPGFGSAAKFIAATVREVGLDSDVYDLKSVTIVEIMGRNAGWLTAASALARNEYLDAPHLIYLPETPFDDERFFSDIEGFKDINNIVVAVSEGIKYEDGSFVCESASSGLLDAFGHKCLSGVSKVLENKVRASLGIKARGIEINVPQRAAAHFASLTDINEAMLTGEYGVKYALEGFSGSFVYIKRVSSKPYEISIEHCPVEMVANEEKKVPLEWINSKGNDVNEKMTEYLTPLIQGNTNLYFKNGLPVYMKL